MRADSVEALSERWIATKNTARPSPNTVLARHYDLNAVAKLLPAGSMEDLALSEVSLSNLESAFADGSIWRDMAAAAVTASVAGPISQAPNVIAAHQQAHLTPLVDTCRAIYAKAGLRGFFGGLLPRTASLAGSLFIFPFTIETVQAKLERWRNE